MNRYFLLAVAAFVAGWTIQEWRYGDEINGLKATYAQAAEKAQEAARTKEQALQTKLNEALNEANERAKRSEELAKKNSVAAVSASRTSDSLRNQLATVRAELSQATAETARNYAAALSTVFGECVEKYRASAERYSELARSATGHASDSKTLEDSWPQLSSKKSGLRGSILLVR